MVQRLKLNSNASEVAEELKHATLRLKFPPQSLEAMKMIEDSGRLKEGEDLCHTFDLSIRAFRLDNRPASPMMGGLQPGEHMRRLVRVRWEGTQLSDEIYDSREHIYASLEFDGEMHRAWKILKNSPVGSLAP